jgi:hypothetical protein
MPTATRCVVSRTTADASSPTPTGWHPSCFRRRTTIRTNRSCRSRAWWRCVRLALERGTIGKLFVIYADGWDLWARLGQVFDNHWGWRRDWSDLQGVRGFEQHGEKNVGHTGIFETAEWDRFDRNGAFDFLSEDVGAEPVLDDDDEEVLGV